MSAIKNISLYIPHVFPNFDREYVAKAFKNIGEVSQIDFVAKQDRNGGNYNAVYVHFNKWYTNKKATNFYNSVVDESKEARLCHDEPWYWIVLPNTAKKHFPGERKPRLDLSESTAVPAPSTTPRKEPIAKVCPNAPQKRSYANAAVEKPVVDEVSFDEVAAFEAEIEAEMDEIEEMLEAEDENLISIDGRYVDRLETENWALNAEVIQLRVALINLDQKYQAEAAKVRAFSSVEL